MTDKVPEIIIHSIKGAEAFIPGPEDICISIRSPGNMRARLSPGFRAILRLWFHDLAGIDPPYPARAVPFTPRDAEEVARFVRQHKDRARRIVVHCEAGISRSVAIALAISTTLYGYWAWPAFMPQEYRDKLYVHNRPVFDLVCAALAAQKEPEQ